MRGRRSSRSAAAVLAGCVGLAVMAPGLALADPVPGVPTPEACTALGHAWKGGVCDDGNSAPATATPPESGSGSGDITGETVEDTIPPGTTTDGTTTDGTTTDGTTTDGTTTDGTTPPAGPAAPSVSGRTQDATTGTGTGNTGTGNTGTGSTTGAPSADLSVAALDNGLSEVQDAADALAPEDVDPLLALPLPGLPGTIPQPDENGNFENVNDACLNAISQLQFPEGTEGLDVLSEQLQGFCSSLDPTTLTDLLDSLIDLLNNLAPSLPTPGSGQIPNNPPSFVPAQYWGYWHEQYDVDCPELTYEEANAILAADRSDPFRLDRDNDGEACEANARGEYVEYIGYPVGGVATGDGSTGSGAAGVEVALAAGALSGLGVTGLVLVRRFARQG